MLSLERLVTQVFDVCHVVTATWTRPS